MPVKHIKQPQTATTNKEPNLEYLKQTADEYTALSLVQVDNNRSWVFRQTDIKDGVIVQVIDSTPNDRDVCSEYFKLAAADQFTRAY